jgi:FAD/FMN-containing dehydrogenase
MTAINEQLSAALGPKAVLQGADVQSRSAGSWGPPRQLIADLLVRPKDTAGVAAALAICHANHQPVVAHGGLTGLVDGARAQRNDVILSLELMNRIEAIDPVGRTMTVQAGVPLQMVQEHAARHGLMFPLDLGARGSATVGGNAATNAGGNRVIRYGMTRDSILGIEAVLADGTIVSSMNSMIKNNAGYDLKQLFIGSEGTLGVITRLVLRLRQQPASQDTAWVAVESFENVTLLLAHMDRALGGTLSAFEVLWQNFYRLVTTPPAQSVAPLGPNHAFYVLVEALGGDQQRDSERFEAALSSAFEADLIADAVIGKSTSERDAMWGIRDDVVQLLNHKPMFMFDVSLAIKDMETYVAGLQNALAAHWPEHHLYVFGHLGDGNLHLGISAGSDTGEACHDVEALVYQPLQAIGGSVSAEHGIGLEKKSYLHFSRSEAELNLMRQLKRTLDPHGILNPGKIFDAAPRPGANGGSPANATK